MYARAFIIFAMVVVASKVEAAATLRGLVLENEKGGPPMASAEDANPNNTGADGKFRFSFPERNPGDTVRLSFRKEGYVVVNDIQLDVTLPANPKEKLALFLLCKKGDREEMASRFYGLKLRAAADDTLRKKIEEAPTGSAAKL